MIPSAGRSSGRPRPFLHLLWPLLVGFLAGLAAAADPPSTPAPPARVPDDVRPVVDRLFEAMGGRGAWDNLRTLRFTFEYSSRDTIRTSRSHWWDKSTGRYRVQGKNRQGQSYVVLFRTDTRDGDAWLDGRRLEGEERAGWLERGYGLFINDVYWLAMPWKLEDPGVQLARDGDAVVDGRPCDRIRVTFGSVGLTPGDTYWAYIDRESHRMIRWGFILEGDRAKPDPRESLYDWTDWERHGPLFLSGSRVKVADPDRTVLHLRDLQVDADWPDTLFTRP